MDSVKLFMVPAEYFVKVDCGVNVQKAVEIMQEHAISSVLVSRKDAVIGILSDTDIVRQVVANGTDPAQITVEQIMLAPIPTIAENQTLQDANDLMAKSQIRHLGISNDGKLVGMISVRDVLVGLTSGPTSVLPPSWIRYQKGMRALERGDYETAVKQFEVLAGQGLARAQYQLGAMYQQGKGVSQNDVQALMWAILAAMKGIDAAVAIQKTLIKEMPADQIVKAERLARDWQSQEKSREF